MKINKKIIIVNIILLFIIFFLLDIFVYYRHLYISHRYNPIYDKVSYFSHIFRKMDRKYIDSIMFDESFYKKPLNTDSNLNSIILFGCSYVEGAVLENNQTFQYLMGKISHRPVYDKSHGGWGTQHMLYLTEGDKLYSELKNPPDIVIYTFIYDHYGRIYSAMEPVIFGGQPTFVYKKGKGKLVFDKVSLFIFRFPFLSYLKQLFNYYYYSEEEKENFLIMHILQSKNNIENYYKRNVKFVVLLYAEDYQIQTLLNKLTENNIKAITFNEITGKSVSDEELIISKEDTHPNAKAWSIVVPKLWNYINSFSDNELTNTDNNLLNINKKVKHFSGESLKSVIKSVNGRRFPSHFSICTKDNELIQNGQLTQSRALAAYTFWCISNLIDYKYTKLFSKIFCKIAIKINPDNDYYKEYFNIRFNQ